MLETISSKKKAAAVSMLVTATACSAASHSSITSSSSAINLPPLHHTTANTCCDNTHHDTNSLSSSSSQAAELLSLRIPRGGSSTEAEASSSNIRSNNKDSKSRKKKRGSSSSSSTSKSNGNKGNNHGSSKQRQSKAASSSSSSSNDDDATTAETNTATTTTQQKQQQQQQQESQSTLPPAAQSILTQTCHYDVLGITKSATQSEIQKAYRRRCVLTHPDKTQGDRSAFDKVSEAYDVLSCENKRAIYDRFGMEGLNSDAMDGNGGGGGGFNDVFREFFGGGMSGMAGFGSQFHPGNGRSSSTSSSSSFGPRNRDLRYQLEVSLEDLYKGTTKNIAIQQPNPLRPHFPLRKEVEVTLTRGMHSGQSVRLSGVVDSIPDAAPADVVFLIKQRRHPVYTRLGSDLAMEVHITLAEAIVGFKRKIVSLDGKEIVIGSPYETMNVLTEELVDAPKLPDLVADDGAIDEVVEKEDGSNSTSTTPSENLTPMKDFPVQQIVKATTTSYHLPSKIIQTGDVHVLKGKGMPIRGVGGHDYGDLYVQYIVDLPGGSSSSASSSLGSSNSQLNTNNLSPQERVELAKLLSKLEGKEDPTTDVIKVWEEGENKDDTDGSEEKSPIHRLSVSSASQFGKSPTSNDDDEEHLHNDDDEGHHGGMHGFFHRAFHGGGGRSHTSGFGGPFGFGASSSGGGFRYYSSSSGGSRGGPVYGDEDGHNDVQCQQM